MCGGPTPERRMRIPVTATVPHNARCALSHFPRTHRYTTSSTQCRSDALLHPLTVPSTSASAARFSPRRVAPAVRPRGLWTMWKYTRDDARAAGKRNRTRAARNSEMSPSCPPTCEVVYISGHAGYEDSLKATLFLTLSGEVAGGTHTDQRSPFVELCVKSKTKTKQCCPQSCMSGLEALRPLGPRVTHRIASRMPGVSFTRSAVNFRAPVRTYIPPSKTGSAGAPAWRRPR